MTSCLCPLTRGSWTKPRSRPRCGRAVILQPWGPQTWCDWPSGIAVASVQYRPGIAPLITCHGCMALAHHQHGATLGLACNIQPLPARGGHRCRSRHSAGRIRRQPRCYSVPPPRRCTRRRRSTICLTHSVTTRPIPSLPDPRVMAAIQEDASSNRDSDSKEKAPPAASVSRESLSDGYGSSDEHVFSDPVVASPGGPCSRRPGTRTGTASTRHSSGRPRRRRNWSARSTCESWSGVYPRKPNQELADRAGPGSCSARWTCTAATSTGPFRTTCWRRSVRASTPACLEILTNPC